MRRMLWIGFAAFSLACGGTMEGSPAGEEGTGGSPSPEPGEPTGGVPEPGVVPPEQQASLDSLTRSLSDVRGLDRAGLDERYPAAFNDELGYAPGEAGWLDLIQSSTLGLNDTELAKLDENGFVISARQSFANFTYGYRNIYYEDLPVFVSLDSVLYALHRSYDSLLLSVEQGALIPALDTLLTSLRAKVASAGLSTTAAGDVELFLDVAAALLSGSAASSSEASAIVAQANAASTIATVELFGSPRDLDFSQYEPRGHYTDREELQRYFRAMMWLGRTDFRLVATQSDGSRELRRREIEAMLGLASLFDDADRDQWDGIDRAIEVFVGEPDSMMLPQVQSFLDDLGIDGPDELGSVADEELIRVLEEGRYGMQRIASHLMTTSDIEATLPLNTSFTFMGQRYVIDSHVFSNVVADRVPGGRGHPLRMMPDPLDVAFAALGNNQAQDLLADQLDTYGYSQQLAETRILADAHEDEYWEGSLYTLWLGSLRQISSPAADDADVAGLPSVARTEPWGRRLLNTQLASWAELRHDTLLYAKQSYTMGYSCEYPDAYVDPYPEAFAAIARFADKGTEMLDALAGSYEISAAANYFARLSTVASTLGGMAEDQRTGAPHSQEELDFINQAVAIETDTSGCAAVSYAVGWYPGLFYNPDDALDSDPTIADVHTQPTDEAGNQVGRILHVGTGHPRLMVVTVDSCEGPRAYVGVVSSYFERVTEGFDRLTDERWAEAVVAGIPSDVPWLQSVIAP